MDEKYQHLVHYIRNVVHELSAAAVAVIRGTVAKISDIKLKFIGGAYSENIVPLNSNGVTTVPLKVDPTKHVHTANSLIAGPMYGTDPNTIRNTAVLRTGANNIHAAGYRMSNGADISSLFVRANTTNIAVETRNANTSGNNVIVSMSLSKSNNRLILQNNWGWVCNCKQKRWCFCCD